MVASKEVLAEGKRSTCEWVVMSSLKAIMVLPHAMVQSGRSFEQSHFVELAQSAVQVQRGLKLRFDPVSSFQPATNDYRCLDWHWHGRRAFFARIIAFLITNET